MRARFGVGFIVAIAALALIGCSSTTVDDGRPDVVATTNVWGSIAAAVAGPDAVVGASGVVTLHYVATAGSPFLYPATYYLSAYTAHASIYAQGLTITVVADPAAAAPGGAPAPVAGPATPVQKVASFTG